MNRAWPLTPLLLIAISVLIAGAGNLMYVRPVIAPAALPVVSSNSSQPHQPADETPLLIIVPRGDSGESMRNVLARSPFSPARAAFSRYAPSEPVPAEPQYNPEFVGLLGKGDTVRAMITWNPGEPAQVHAIGDPTPWGELVSASSNELLFEGPAGEKLLKLF
ncbi:hypothetical protein HNE_2523 [Hyphomonas neptunium ATCC 15444]|uniref:Uncharacterized protein n=2 Tax=Hyphomonas TaxID=85 RepID=Q0BZ76_HYPNA|nr:MULTISPECIES: hypothetical protein [Hyphomonas]ABI75947.1 hypothetical protein HNE_2523 [Hyphomonas neptunium ATCC 15444]KCZ95306.1 hypothetical protein HHI_06534 [Hyphomonas hirschiana VP5]